MTDHKKIEKLAFGKSKNNLFKVNMPIGGRDIKFPPRLNERIIFTRIQINSQFYHNY